MRIDPELSELPAASTLILVRQHAGELQTYLLRRSPGSGFMPGLFVFPGGLVDPADGDDVFWTDRLDVAPQAFAERLCSGMGFSAGLRYAVAAVRETFEEAGVLFASRAADGAAAWGLASRRRLTEGLRRGWLRDWAAIEGWTLVLSALWPWAHWITPVGMPRRFDTRFFVAVLPEGQDGRPDLHETTEGVWISPGHALAQNMDGRTPLSPPTLVTLQALLGFPTLSGLQEGLKHRVWGEPIFPRLVPLGKGRGAVIIEPWDPAYGQEDLRVDTDRLPQCLLPVGAPFSRLWNDGGVWKPVELD
jgi:8-oxo-dGTP pyrophosphatase MutT (NUDIX family)